jgi:hypothetical protein
MALVEHEHGETEVVKGEKVAEGAAKTHFEANNAYVDVPMMKDLSKETCQALIGYTVSIQDKCSRRSLRRM